MTGQRLSSRKASAAPHHAGGFAQRGHRPAAAPHKTKDGKGRCAALEILIGSNALTSIIREGKINQIESMIQTGTGQGMQTMDQCLQKMIDDDKITVAAAREKAINKNLFPVQDGE